jgi:lipid A disaccharide synthetase
MTRIVVCSGEPSGDAMVRELVPALRERFRSGVRLSVLTSSPIEGLAEHEVFCSAPEPVLGDSVAGALRWRPVLENVWESLEADPPALFIAVAHHGFNLVLAAELKALPGAATKTLMVAPPEIWAWDVRPWLRALAPPLRWIAPSRQSVPFVLQAMLDRGRSTVQLFDGIACPLEPDVNAYRHLARECRKDTLIVKVGHTFARYADTTERKRAHDAGRALRANLAPSPDDLLVGLFPGSREAEVDRLLPVMLAALSRLRDRFGDRLKLVAAASDERRAAQTRHLLDTRSRGHSPAPPALVTGRGEEVLSAADFGLLCSGTVTLLAATLARPSIVVYDREWGLGRTLLASLLLRRGRVSSQSGAAKVPFSLPSAVLGQRVFRELWMRQCTPERIAKSLEELIDDGHASACAASSSGCWTFSSRRPSAPDSGAWTTRLCSESPRSVSTSSRDRPTASEAHRRPAHVGTPRCRRKRRNRLFLRLKKWRYRSLIDRLSIE